MGPRSRPRGGMRLAKTVGEWAKMGARRLKWAFHRPVWGERLRNVSKPFTVYVSSESGRELPVAQSGGRHGAVRPRKAGRCS